MSSVPREVKPHTKCLQDHLERWILKHDQIYHSLEFPSGPGDFDCDLPELVGNFLDYGFGGTEDEGPAGEVELDSE